jgi:putative transferase (TIGR04331 family)
MFLVTTADQRFWKTDEPVLFLGEWCKLYSQRHIWERLDYEVLPYHWDDRDKLYRDYFYVSQKYEKYLNLLSIRLNEIHHVSYPVRYWRIVAGEWLHFFIEILYDRYCSIVAAANTAKITDTWILPSPDWTWVPKDFSTFYNWFVSDDYNHYLYSYIIKSIGEIPFHIKETNKEKHVFKKQSKINLLRNIIKPYTKLIPGFLNKIIFVSSYLSLKDLTKLQLSLGQAPYPFSPKCLTPDYQPDPSLRKRIVFNGDEDQFESLLNNLLPEQIPVVYMEGYTEMQYRALASFPNHPDLIYTANAFSSDEGFKIWAAHNVNMGAKLIIGQHGGHYGSGLWSTTEDHEINLSDNYFTWGWRENGNEKTVPMSSGSLTGLKYGITHNPKGNILWVAMSLPRYSYFLFSAPIGPQVINYIKEQERFAAAVSQDVHDLLLLRLSHTDFGWDQEKRWAEIAPNLKIYHGTKSMKQQIQGSRLLISTYNATTYLESFTANLPTIIFWNPKHWELRDTAQPFFNELQQAGILHYTPESAAAKVNEIYQDPIAWWQQPEIQEAKNEFCHQFARVSDNWLSEWKSELLEIRQ